MSNTPTDEKGIENEELQLTNIEAQTLRALGLKWIQEDDEALIDYAVNKILYDLFCKTEQKNILLTKLIEKEKNLKQRSETNVSRTTDTGIKS